MRQFDYRTLEDVVIHVDYTARNGGQSMRGDAESSVVARLNQIHGDQPLALVVAVHDAFPNEWQQMFEVEDGDHILTLPLTPEHFPYLAQRSGLSLRQADFALLLDPSVTSVSSFPASLTLVQNPVNFMQKQGDAFTRASFTLASAAPDTMTLRFAGNDVPAELRTDGEFDPDKLAGMLLLIHYTLGA